MPRTDARNVLGGRLAACSFDPLTGWQRDGCCHTDDQNGGQHLVCARVNLAFLNHQVEQGNDLITARPELRFAGLKPGDRWCVHALRWRQAYLDGFAPPVVLEATHARATEIVPLAWLLENAFDAMG